MGWAGHVSVWAGGEDRFKEGLVGKPEGKTRQVRPRHRSGDNIKICRQEVGLGGGGGMDWNYLGQDRDRWWAFVNAVMNFMLWFRAS
jgi:hypothetical protein